MRNIVSVSPFRCRMWALHDRLEGYVTEDSCKAEIESFSKHGQLVPVLGRRLANDLTYEIELIYGARRWFVARHLNVALHVELRALTDVEAVIAMDIENRHRSDITLYERGMSYARWIRAGFFKSQEEIARALGLSASQVSRLLKIAALPAVIVNAFGAPKDIREAWGLHLMDLLEDPRKREATLRVARAICKESPRPSGDEVYRQLLSAAPGRGSIKLRRHDDVVKSTDGATLFRIRYQRNSVAFVVPLERLSAQSVDTIHRILTFALANNLVHADGDCRGGKGHLGWDDKPCEGALDVAPHRIPTSP